MLKEVKDDVNKWKNPLKSHVNGLEDLILLRCLYYPKWSTYLMQSLSKIKVIFREMDKPVLKFIWNYILYKLNIYIYSLIIYKNLEKIL